MKPAPSAPHDGWLELAKHAREVGIPERTLRRRLTALHQRLGGGVLRSYNAPGTNVRKWWFNPVALKAGLEREPEDTEAALGDHLLRIEELEERVNALRQAYRHLKRRASGSSARG